MLVAVVLGMHKSGTTVVSETLHHSGIDMVEMDHGGTYDGGQQYERAATNILNRQILGAAYLHSLDTVVRAEAMDAIAEARARDLVLELSAGRSDWGFKDPRTCLTYPLWNPLLPPHKLICVFRTPREVYRHYRDRGRSGQKALHAWYVYNEAMLSAYRGAPEESRIMLDYQALMDSDEGLGRLAHLLGRPLADRRNQQLRRSAAAIDASIEDAMTDYRAISGNDLISLNEQLAQIARPDPSH